MISVTRVDCHNYAIIPCPFPAAAYLVAVFFPARRSYACSASCSCGTKSAARQACTTFIDMRILFCIHATRWCTWQFFPFFCSYQHSERNGSVCRHCLTYQPPPNRHCARPACPSPRNCIKLTRLSRAISFVVGEFLCLSTLYMARRCRGVASLWAYMRIFESSFYI